ncbi:MAG TPA: diguanylate cyclase [Ktedonobacteraceae bacterium]|nr:diguanylate cyclase [Ktedonobacteraceae bacterium]
MDIHEQEFYRSSPHIPRSFWYSVAFGGMYFLVYGGWVILYESPSPSFQAVGSIGMLLAIILSFVLSWVGIKRHGGKRDGRSPRLPFQRRLHSWVPLIFSIALLFESLANILYGYYYTHHIYTFPGLNDAMALATYPTLMLGIWFLPARSLSRQGRLRALLDSLMMIVALLAFGWYFLLGPLLLHIVEASLFVTLAHIAFPAAELLLISCLILFTARVPGRILRPTVSLISIGLVAFVLSGIVWQYTLVKHMTYTLGWYTLGWPVGCFLIALSTQTMRWLPDQRTTEDDARHEDVSTTGPLWRMLLPYAFVPAAMGLAFYVWNTDRGGILAVGTYCCELLLLALIFSRQIIAMREIHHLNGDLQRAKQALHEKNAALERANTRLESLATTDMLTELPNYRALQTLLEQEGERARRFGHSLSMLFFDGDRFKQVNDTYGHAVGDVVLCELSERARSILRAGDTIGRFGGEEFLVLLPETDGQEAQIIAERLRSAVAASPLAAYAVAGGISVTVSIGVASYPTDGATISDIQEQTDQAMYWAKRLGRNQVRTAAEAAHANQDAALKVATAHALERPELAALDGRDTEQQLRAEQLGLIYALIGMLDLRDPGASEHAHEVSDLVAGMARLLRFDEARALQATAAAFLHDIGKIALSDRLLLQPQQHFSAQEWRQLHQHAELGADIVEASPRLSNLAPAIRHHHERWDGTGDPDGLAGEAIPLEARLIAVAEAYHSMISEQPYQAARSVGEALAELERCAGTQFDPALLPIFQEVLESRQGPGGHFGERTGRDRLVHV